MKMVRMIKAVRVILVAVAMSAAALLSPGQTEALLNYRGLVDEIGRFLNEARVQYRQGNIPAAQQNAQDAYFQVFENLEGPIRINVSARKCYELEAELTGIHDMIAAKEPAAAIEARMNDFMSQLSALVPELEKGVELVAEGPEETAPSAGSAVQGAEKIDPIWLRAFENIRGGLGNAFDAYRKGDPTRGAELVIQTQYDYYKNTLLETAIRRHISQKKDAENNSGFAEIASMISGGEAPVAVESRIAALIAGLQADLPGLPVVEGAVPRKEAAGMAERGAAGKESGQMTTDLFGELDRALALYGQGESERAVALVQNAYFDLFEGSGMEARLAPRDVAARAGREEHFNTIVGQMKRGAAVDEIRATLQAMKGDFDGAAIFSAGSPDSSAYFFRPLMVILRERLAAILVTFASVVAALVLMAKRRSARAGR